VNFAPVSLERLIDSPVLASEFFRAVSLKSDWPAELDITGDSQAAIDKADDANAFALFWEAGGSGSLDVWLPALADPAHSRVAK
jgi:hypothetical protein